MPWIDHLKSDSKWMSEYLPGNENKLWQFGRQAFSNGHFQELTSLTEWASEAEFQNKRIGNDYEIAMFSQLATGMAFGLAALGHWKQGHSHPCLELLQQSAYAYQKAIDPTGIPKHQPDLTSIALTETDIEQAFLDRALATLEGDYPVGGGMLRTLVSYLVPNREAEQLGELRLRVLLDDAVRVGDSPLLELRLFSGAAGSSCCHPDPVRLGCTVLDSEFLESQRLALSLAKERLPRNGRIVWGLNMADTCNHLRGPSAGAAFVAGFCGLAEGLEFDAGVAMTAAVDTDGRLLPVSAVPTKIKHAVSLGIRRFVLSPRDAESYRSRLETDFPEISIVSAENVSQTLEHLKGQAKEVRLFLEKLINEGLLRHIPNRPRFIETGKDLLEFCLPPKVIDEDLWVKDKMRRKAEGKNSNRTEQDDEDGYSPLYRERYYHRSDRERVQPPKVLTPPQDRRQILVGKPGEGKSTALWLMVAQQCLSLLEIQQTGNPIEASLDFQVPLAVPLGIIEETKSQRSLITRARDYVIELTGLTGPTEETLKQWLDEKISRNEYTLYLDALDELPGGRRSQDWLWTELDSLAPGIPLLLTTRESVADRAHARVRNPQRLGMVCFGLYSETYEYIKRFFKHQPDLGEELQQLRFEDPGPGSLMQLPLLLELLCEIKQQNPEVEVPRTHTKVLEKGLRHLLRRGEEKRNVEEVKSQRIRKKEEILRHVAWTFHAEEPLPIPEDRLVDLLEKQYSSIRQSTPEDGEALLKEFLQDGILVARGEGNYTFVLRSFHEFCLAGWIAKDAPFCVDRENFQRVVLGDHVAWDRPDWSSFTPIKDDNWRYIWAMVAGRLEEKAEWLTSALWTPEQMCPVTRDDLKSLRLLYEIVKEASDSELRKKIAFEIEEAVFPLLIEGSDYSFFHTSDSPPSNAMFLKSHDEFYGIEFEDDFAWVDAWGTILRHLDDQSERLETRIACVKIAGVDSGGGASKWYVSNPGTLQTILDDPSEPPALRLLCYQYLATGEEIDYEQIPDIWEINFQVYSDWLQPTLLTCVNELASNSVEAVRRRILAVEADTKLALARDFLASDSASISAKCEVVNLMCGGITDYALQDFYMYEPNLLFDFEFNEWGSSLRLRHQADFEYQQWEEDNAEPLDWSMGPEEYKRYHSGYRDEPYVLTPPPFLDEGPETAILLRVLNDCGEDTWLRRLCAIHLGFAYRPTFDAWEYNSSDLGEAGLAWFRKMIDRSKAVERLIERIALDQNEPWMLRCTCARLLFFQFQTIWEVAAERAAKFLANVVMDEVDEVNTDARIFQEFAVETFLDTERQMEQFWPGDRELQSLTKIAEAEFGERFLHALWGLGAGGFDLEPFLAEQRNWPQLAGDADATEESAWREYVLQTCNNDDHSDDDLIRFAETLAKIDDPKCVDWLRARLNNENASIKVRQACALAFHDRGGEADLDLLFEKFEDEETADELRGQCAWCLIHSDWFDRVHHKILAYILDEKQSEVFRSDCLYAALATSKYEELKSVCIPLLKNVTTPECLVEQASTALAAWQDSDDLSCQLEVIDNQAVSEKLRCSIISNLVCYDEALQPLLDRIADTEFPERLRFECAEALNAWLKSDKFRDQIEPIFRALLSDPDTPRALKTECRKHLDS